MRRLNWMKSLLLLKFFCFFCFKKRRFLLLPLVLTSCYRPVPPPPKPVAQVHYVREAAWLGDGEWFYPQEMTELDQTGLATVEAADHPAFTTDGELYDPTALTAAHQTLQLPAIVSVTDLENGRQIEVRVNDRGPGDPGRVIALSPRAAALLQILPGSAAQVRVVLQAAPTQQLALLLHGGGLRLAMNTAPLASVASQDLAPPAGIAQSRRGMDVARPGPAAADQAATVASVPDRLPENILLTAPDPGQLYIQADEFSRAEYAFREAAMLAPYGHVVRERRARSEQYSVRGGPYATVADADAELKLVLRLGLRGARIVVQ